MKIGELFAEIGIKADTKQLDNFERGLKSAAKSATKLAAVATGVSLAIGGMIKLTTSQAIAFKDFRMQTDLSITKLQQLGFWATKNDITMSESISTLEGMKQAIAAIQLGTGGSLAFFKTTNIDIDQDIFSILEDFAKAVKDWDPGIAANIAARLNIPPKFLNILRQSTFQMHSLNKEFVLTDKQRGKLFELNRAFKGYLFILRNVGDQIMSMSTGPLLLLIDFLKNIASGTKEVAKKFKDLWDSSEELRVILAALAVIFLFLAAPKTGLIGLLALAFEDLAVAWKHGDSILGPYIEKFKILVEWTKKLWKLTAPSRKVWREVGAEAVRKVDARRKLQGKPVPMTWREFWVKFLGSFGKASENSLARMDASNSVLKNNVSVDNFSRSAGSPLKIENIQINIDGSTDVETTAKAVHDELLSAVYYAFSTGDSS